MTRAERWITGSIGALVVLVGVVGAIWYSSQTSRDIHPAPTSTPATPSEQSPSVKNEAPAASTKTALTSPRGVTIKLDAPLENHVIASPLTITGQVPGNWSFEASFPIILKASDGTVITQTSAHLTGDWMTTAYVPFTATLTYTTTATTGELVFNRDNPSGLAEKDDAVVIPVRLSE